MPTGTAEAGGRCQGAGDPGDFSTPGGAIGGRCFGFYRRNRSWDVMGCISWISMNLPMIFMVIKNGDSI